MIGAFAAATATLFADPYLSAPASLQRPNQTAIPLRVIRRDLTQEGMVAGSSTSSTGATFEVLRSACPDKPEDDTLIRIDGETWAVFEAQANERRGTWMLSCQAG